MGGALAKEIAALGFEEALAELEAIVNAVEGGKISLDQAITSYTRGMALKEHCEKKLAEAQLKIEQVVQKKE